MTRFHKLPKSAIDLDKSLSSFIDKSFFLTRRERGVHNELRFKPCLTKFKLEF